MATTLRSPRFRRITSAPNSDVIIDGGLTVSGTVTAGAVVDGGGNITLAVNMNVQGILTAESDFVAKASSGNLIETDQSASKIGFFGATPVTVPNVTSVTPDVQDIIDALVDLGLVTNT